ncbi:MAG: transposase [Actinomycetota bacterium]|nr:transposase [Actinomycetota bacterium]
MARVPRSALPDGAYHITARGVDGAPIVLDDLDRLFFARLLRSTALTLDWGLHAWCLLTNHFHLVVEAPRIRVSAGMKRINGLYAQRFNLRHARRGHLFQDRFASWVIEDDDYLETVCGYVLANPVRAGLVRSVEEWRWAGLGIPSFAPGSPLRRAA